MGGPLLDSRSFSSFPAGCESQSSGAPTVVPGQQHVVSSGNLLKILGLHLKPNKSKIGGGVGPSNLFQKIPRELP